ncbi:hypothetical protein yc1106_00241 [Curvularia clavata]|uniref:Trichothecene 3-O-acetyltransferase-like N-terminal domain-containing protein n=1 Tax=Curvularia clavata TaxID=95742 RepID=A0A9Q9DN73_CURCL|nr:hypothetical protein yc1106_00241 [Curvularia clavata]
MSDNEKELELSFLDQQSHIRVYGRYYIVFSFPDIKHAYEATRSLHIGFKEVLRQFPYLAGTVRMPYIAKDDLQVLFPSPIDLETEASRIFTSSLRPAANDFDYAKLAKEHFSPGCLPAEIFCPDLIKHHPGLDDNDPFGEGRTSLTKGPLPVFAAHATFIPGDLVLSVWFYHAVIDGKGNTRIQEVWSTAVRSLRHYTQGTGTIEASLEVKAGDNATDPNLARGELTSLAHQVDVGNDITRPEKTFRYPLRESSYRVITKMFRFPAPVINGLREAVSNLQNKHISHFSALAAVIWANIIQARLPLLIASGSTKSTLAIVVDLRKHLRAPFSSPDYLGNLVFSEMPTWDLFEQANSIIGRVVKDEEDVPDYLREYFKSSEPRAVVREARLKLVVPTLTYFAAEIHDAVHSIDEKRIGKQLGQVLANPFHTNHSILTFCNGPDLYITSWQHMGADREWCIPGTGDTQPSAIRRAAWASEGGIVVLPRKADKEGNMSAPYEVMISLAEKDMDAFENSLEEGRWLKDRCWNV